MKRLIIFLVFCMLTVLSFGSSFNFHTSSEKLTTLFSWYGSTTCTGGNVDKISLSSFYTSGIASGYTTPVYPNTPKNLNPSISTNAYSSVSLSSGTESAYMTAWASWSNIYIRVLQLETSNLCGVLLFSM